MRLSLRFVPDMISAQFYSVPVSVFELVSDGVPRHCSLGDGLIRCTGVIVDMPDRGPLTRIDGSSVRRILLRNRHAGEFDLKSGCALYVEDIVETPQLINADPIVIRHQNIGVASLVSTTP